MELRQLLKGIEAIDETTGPNGVVSSICYAAHQCVGNSLFVAIRLEVQADL